MTDGPLTILQVTHQGGPAGSTQSIFNLSQHLARRGHRVLVGCREHALLARWARAAGLPRGPLQIPPPRTPPPPLAGAVARGRAGVVNPPPTPRRRAPARPRRRGRPPPAPLPP